MIAKMPKGKKNAGFSLVELMVVVGIIGVLSALAVPRFKQFQAKARMAESRTMLNSIHALQESYHLDNNTYMAFPIYGRRSNGGLSCARPAGATALGFTIDPCVAGGTTPRYGYLSSGNVTVFVARGQSGNLGGNLVCPGNLAHEFNINQVRQIRGPVRVTNNNQVGTCN